MPNNTPKFKKRKRKTQKNQKKDTLFSEKREKCIQNSLSREYFKKRRCFVNRVPSGLKTREGFDFLRKKAYIIMIYVLF